VYWHDGTAVINQPDCLVDLIACPAGNAASSGGGHKFVITIEHEIPNGPEELIAQDDHKPWSGMVTVKAYG
jgi:hypothetical protein